MDSTRFEEIVDEVTALQSIFCRHGEFELETSLRLDSAIFAVHFAINLKCEDNESSVIKMIVSLDENYPHDIPKLAVSSTNFSKKELSQILEQLVTFAQEIRGSPMILELATWLKQNATLIKSEQSHTPETKTTINKKDVRHEDRRLILLRVDHMRSKQRYCKIISNWVNELELSGRIIFHGHLILIILLGHKESVQKYLRLHRTCVVDVDSAGRPCKERMMDIVCERDLSEEDSEM